MPQTRLNPFEIDEPVLTPAQQQAEERRRMQLAERERDREYRDRGIQVDRDVSGRVFPVQSERNRALGIEGMRPDESGRIDWRNQRRQLETDIFSRPPPRPQEDPRAEVRAQIKQVETEIKGLDQYVAGKSRELERFDEEHGFRFERVHGSDELKDNSEIAKRIQSLSEQKGERLDWFSSIVRPGRSGDLTPEAREALRQLKADPEIHRYRLRLEKRQRILDEIERANQAKATFDQQRTELLGQKFLPGDETDPEGPQHDFDDPVAPATPEPEPVPEAIAPEPEPVRAPYEGGALIREGDVTQPLPPGYRREAEPSEHAGFLSVRDVPLTAEDEARRGQITVDGRPYPPEAADDDPLAPEPEAQPEPDPAPAIAEQPEAPEEPEPFTPAEEQPSDDPLEPVAQEETARDASPLIPPVRTGMERRMAERDRQRVETAEREPVVSEVPEEPETGPREVRPLDDRGMARTEDGKALYSVSGEGEIHFNADADLLESLQDLVDREALDAETARGIAANAGYEQVGESGTFSRDFRVPTRRVPLGQGTYADQPMPINHPGSRWNPKFTRAFGEEVQRLMSDIRERSPDTREVVTFDEDGEAEIREVPSHASKKDRGFMAQLRKSFFDTFIGDYAKAWDAFRINRMAPKFDQETTDKTEDQAREAARRLMAPYVLGFRSLDEDAQNLSEQIGEATGFVGAFLVPGAPQATARAGSKMLVNPQWFSQAPIMARTVRSTAAEGATRGAAAGAGFAAFRPPGTILPERGEFAEDWANQAMYDVGGFATFGAAMGTVSRLVAPAFWRGVNLKPAEGNREIARIAKKFRDKEPLTREESRLAEQFLREVHARAQRGDYSKFDAEFQVWRPREWTQEVPFLREMIQPAAGIRAHGREALREGPRRLTEPRPQVEGRAPDAPRRPSEPFREAAPRPKTAKERLEEGFAQPKPDAPKPPEAPKPQPEPTAPAKSETPRPEPSKPTTPPRSPGITSPQKAARDQLTERIQTMFRERAPGMPEMVVSRSKSGVLRAIEQAKYNDYMHPKNAESRAIFEELTGETLPPTAKETREFFDGRKEKPFELMESPQVEAPVVQAVSNEGESEALPETPEGKTDSPPAKPERVETFAAAEPPTVATRVSEALAERTKDMPAAQAERMTRALIRSIEKSAYTDAMNPKSTPTREAFEELTGQPLPKTAAETRKFFAERKGEPFDLVEAEPMTKAPTESVESGSESVAADVDPKKTDTSVESGNELVLEAKPSVERAAEMAKTASPKQMRVQKEFLLNALDETIQATTEKPGMNAATNAWAKLDELSGGPSRNTRIKPTDTILDQLAEMPELASVVARARNDKGMLPADLYQAVTDALPRVRIEIPGDGSFTIPLVPDKLKAFRKRAEHMFGRGLTSRNPSVPSGKAASFSMPKVASASKALELFTGKGDRSERFGSVIEANNARIATDGRRVMVIAGPGKKTVNNADLAGRIQGVVKPYGLSIQKGRPVVKGKADLTIPTEEGWHLARSARLAEADGEDSTAYLYIGKGGKLGVRSSPAEPQVQAGEHASMGKPEFVSEGVIEGSSAKIAIDPNFLTDLFEAARILKAPEVKIHFKDESALTFEIGNQVAGIIMDKKVGEDALRFGKATDTAKKETPKTETKAKESKADPEVLDAVGYSAGRSPKPPSMSGGGYTKGTQSTRIEVAPILGGKPKSPEKILLDFGKLSNIRVRVARPPKSRWLGTYYRGSGRTEIRFAGDLDTAPHEIGHNLEHRYGLLSEWIDQEFHIFDAELSAFWPHGSTTPDSPLPIKRIEGVAEWIRAFVVNPAEAEANAPRFTAYYYEKVPLDAQKAITAFSNDVRTWAGAGKMDQTVSNIRLEAEKKGLLERAKETLTDFPHDFMAAMVDDGHWIWRMVAHVAEMRGIDHLPPSQHPFIMAQVFKGAPTKIERVFEHGMIDAKENFLPEFEGKGFAALYEHFDKSSPKTFNDSKAATAALMVSERTLERADQIDAEVGQVVAELADRIMRRHEDEIQGIDAVEKQLGRIVERVDRKTGNALKKSEEDLTNATESAMGKIAGQLDVLAERLQSRNSEAANKMRKTSKRLASRVDTLGRREQKDLSKVRDSLGKRGDHLAKGIARALDRVASANEATGTEIGKYVARLRKKAEMRFASQMNRLAVHAERRQAMADARKSRLSGAGGGIFQDHRQAAETIAEIQRSPEQYEMARKSAEVYRKWADAVLRYAVDKGLLSQDAYQAIKKKNTHYVSMQRIIEDLDPQMAKSNARFFGRDTKILYRFKGSTRTIEDPYKSLMKQTVLIMREADRNEVLQTIRNLLVQTPRDYREPQIDLDFWGSRASKKDNSTVTIYVNGKPEYWQFNKDVHRALKGQFDSVNSGITMKVLTLPRNILHQAIVLYPGFWVRSTLKDVAYKQHMSKVGTGVSDSFTWTPKEMAKLKKDFEVGGGGLFGHYSTSDNAILKQINRTVEQAKAKGDLRYIVTTPSQLYRGAYEIGAKAETLGRLVEYKNALKYAKEELGLDDFEARKLAVWIARDLTDYARAGWIAREINRFVVFYTAATRGVVHTVERMAGKSALLTGAGGLPPVVPPPPGGFSTGDLFPEKEPKAMKGALKRIPKPFRLPVLIATNVLAYHLAALTAERAWASITISEEELDQQPAYVKRLFYMFKIGDDRWIAMPNSWEVGIAGASTLKLIYNRFFNGADEVDWREYIGGISRAATPVDGGTLLGPYRALVEPMMNRDVFRQRYIVPPHEEQRDLDLRPSMERQSSRVGLILSQGIGVDARKIDHFITGQFGSFGRSALDLSDIGREERRGPREIPASLGGVTRRTPAWNAADVQWVLDHARRRGIQQTRDVQDLYSLLGRYSEAKTAKERDEAARRAREYATQLRERLEQQEQRALRRGFNPFNEDETARAAVRGGLNPFDE